MKVTNKINGYHFSTYGSGIENAIYSLNNLYNLQEYAQKAKELNIPIKYERSTYDNSFELVPYDDEITIMESRDATIGEKIEEITGRITNFPNVEKLVFSYKNWGKINEEVRIILLKHYDIKLDNDVDYDDYDED